MKDYPEDSPEFQETFLWVDATTEGAEQGHYVWLENLQIAEYPKEHDYPMAKGARRMNESLDENWHVVTKAFDGFNQKLWDYTKQKHDERMDAFMACSRKCEKALRDYYNEVVYDGED